VNSASAVTTEEHMMLQSLISLSDEEIEVVTRAVREWCILQRCEIDSHEGRRALRHAIDLVQCKNADDTLMAELTSRLAPIDGIGNGQ
jgi:hypothetical protein